MKQDHKSHAEPILLGFAQRTFPRGSRPRIHFRWGRILAALLGLAAAGWLAVAGALYFWFKKKHHYDEVTYVKMVALPFRVEAHRRELGDFHVEKAKALIAEKNYREAFEYLRAGVARSHGNLDGRRMLAEFYDFGHHLHDEAAKTLVKGVEHGGVDDPQYMSSVYRFLLQHEYDDRIIELGEELLKEEIEQDKVSRLTALATATAYFNLYKYDRALRHIEQYNLLEVPEGNILVAQVHWSRGQREEALQVLAGTTRKFPAAAQVYTRISDFHAEAGDLHAARRNAVLAQVTNPLSQDVALKVLELECQLDMVDRADNSFQDVLDNFSGDRASLLKTASTVARLGRPGYAVQVESRAAQAGIDDARFPLAVLSARILGGEHEAAFTQATGLLASSGQWKVGYHRSMLLCLLSAASFGKGDPEQGRIHLRDFLQSKEPPADEIHHLALHFEKLGLPVQERQVLEFGQQKHPGYRPILEDLVRRALARRDYASFPEDLRTMLEVRRKDAHLLLECQAAMASDQFIFLPGRDELIESLDNTLHKVEQAGGLPAPGPPES